MSTRVQWRKGNTAQTAAFTGALAEITVDTDKKVIVVHDGVTAGGNPAPSLAFVQSVLQRANSAFDAANNAVDTWVRDQANSAYNKANSATVLAQGAYDAANNVAPQIQPTYDKANNAFAQANLAYIQANTSFGVAVSAFGQANVAFDTANNAVTSGQANVGAGLITVTSAYQANVGAGRLADQASSQANVGAAVISVTSAYQANAGAGDISVTNAWQANTGALNIAKFDKSGGNISGSANVASNVKVGTYIDLVGQSSDPTKVEGRIWYNSTDHVTKVATDISGIDTELGRQLTIKVYNDSGSTITKGMAVYVTGGIPNEAPNVAAARADSYSTIDSLLGAAQGSIAAGDYGYVVTNGPLTGVDTSGVPAGSIVYVSEASAGGYTAADLAPPNYAVHLGVCLVSHATSGVLYVDKKGIEWGANFSDGAIGFGNGYRLSQDPTHFYWDATNRRLGVGTNTPTANLHVQGDAYLSGNVQIVGNLVVTNAQSISTSTLTVSGNTVVLNDGFSGTPSVGARIVVERGDFANSEIYWDESADEWLIYSGSGTAGHIISSESTANTWAVYDAMDVYDKEHYPIGANLANSINELAKTAWNAANTAVTSGQANVGAAVISITSAYQANVGAGLITEVTARQANVGSAIAQGQANVGAGLISVTSAYQANVGAARIGDKALWEANTGVGLITVTSAYQANVGAGLITKVAKAGDSMTGALVASALTSNTTLTVGSTNLVGMSSNTYTTASTTQVSIDSFATATYRSATYFVQMTSGSAYHCIQLSLIHDGTSVWLSQYGEIFTGSSLGTFDASISTGTLNLLFTAANAVTVVKLVRTTLVT